MRVNKRTAKWNVISATGMVAIAMMGLQPAVAGPLTPVSAANPKAPGLASPNVLSPEFREVTVAQGSTPLENGSNSTSRYYGYSNDGPMVPTPGDLPSSTHKVEATKTEPDKNTYLVLDGIRGADPNYNYGKRFLFQGHENGANGQGILTRINLDADGAHRVTLLAETDKNGNPLKTIDGSTWYPFSQRLLFSSEVSGTGRIYQANLEVPAVVEDLSSVMGLGGYEGLQADNVGNIIIIEDVGGKAGATNDHAKQPNSFVYRFVPKNPSNLLTGGKLQALQVKSLRTGTPIAFHDGQADADILSDDVLDLHTYGKVFDAQWITLHDTDVQGAVAFDANKAAKDNGATPFKRPENGQFRPLSNFTEFYFDETGDTDSRTQAGSAYGGFGSIMKLMQNPHNDKARLTMFYRGDLDHTGLDNVGFLTANKIVFVEDRGDTLHTQHNALDSAWIFDVRTDYSNSANQPVRMLAEGRDAAATTDSAFSGMSGFQNDGDNEITGFHVSDGDASVQGLLGAKAPLPFLFGWRVFYTAQHGDNRTLEILPTLNWPVTPME